MRSSSSLSASSGRSTPLFGRRLSTAETGRPASSRGFRPLSPPKYMTPRSRPGSAMGSRPLTPMQRQEAYTGTIKVSIRPKPRADLGRGETPNWHIDEWHNSITNTADTTSYSFDNVFAASTSVSNRHVYSKSCAHLVKSFVHEGYNCTLFAYGMTGSGKTYSMRGTQEDPGFIRLAIDDIFTQTEGGGTHTLSVSYLEIYNEKIVDLLAQGPPSHTDLKIRDDVEYGTKIVGICSPEVTSKDHLLQLLKTGDARRKTSATDYNARSSRSHAILQLRLHTVDPVANTQNSRTLSLCDLAGSERATSSAERRKEGAFINKSLLALSTVINKLSLASFGGEHIPYRDLKLTRLLQPALSGSALILILCTVHLGANSPNALDQQQVVTETSNTLRFAARAKDIVMDVTKPKKTVLAGTEAAKIIDDLRRTVLAQQQQIETLKNGSLSISPTSTSSTSTSSVSNIEVAALEAEVRVQNEKIEHLLRLTDVQKTETILLRNDALNDILGVDLDKGLLQMMMANLEEFYSRVNYEMEEHKAYISHLEKQLRLAHQENAGSRPVATEASKSDSQLQELLREQEEEIFLLKESLKDKDHIIHSLTKTSKLRRLVDSSSTTSTDFLKRPSLSGTAGTPLSNKENNTPSVRGFNLSPTRQAYSS